MNAFKKTINAFFMTIPILLGVLMLIALLQVFVDINQLLQIFQGNIILDSILGTAVGSLLMGNPITSYVLGGEFFNSGVSIIVVVSFIVAWVTVGVIQLPAESVMLGKKFALIRNGLSFLSSILIGILTYFLLQIF